MTLHLVKLCVGIDSVAHLAERQAGRLARMSAKGEPAELFHRTRQTPRRGSELLDGGSLYWVIKGMILAHQKIVDLRAVRGEDGIARCDIILDARLILTRPHPRRAFQGWRYLPFEDAPADFGPGISGLDEIPPDMRQELLELGLI